MYQAIGINTGKVYAKGSRADCFRSLSKKFPYMARKGGKWGRGNIVTEQPIFSEPIRIIRVDRKLMLSK